MNGVKVFQKDLLPFCKDHIFRKNEHHYNFTRGEGIKNYAEGALNFHKQNIKEMSNLCLDQEIEVKFTEDETGFIFPDYSKKGYYIYISSYHIGKLSKGLLNSKKRDRKNIPNPNKRINPLLNTLSLIEYGIVKSYYHNLLTDCLKKELADENEFMEYVGNKLFYSLDNPEKNQENNKEQNILIPIEENRHTIDKHIQNIEKEYGLTQKYMGEYCESAKKELEEMLKETEQDKNNIKIVINYLDKYLKPKTQQHKTKDTDWKNFGKLMKIINNKITYL